MTCDPKCLDLASDWCDAEPERERDLSLRQASERRASLAQAIQEAIEDWLNDEDAGRFPWRTGRRF